MTASARLLNAVASGVSGHCGWRALPTLPYFPVALGEQIGHTRQLVGQGTRLIAATTAG
jgi:hypothetical protein